jgi:hypothetical protein
MTRSVRTLSIVCLLPFFARLAGAQCLPPRDPHIRSGHEALLDALATGVKASPMLRGITSSIESSDVVVYVVFEPSSRNGVAAHVSFISAAGGRRYLHVGIDPRYSGTQLIALLGHELQHAAEIAAEASVVDSRTLTDFYRRVGFGGTVGTREHFESDRAIEAGFRVGREAHAFLAAEARAAVRATR